MVDGNQPVGRVFHTLVQRLGKGVRRNVSLAPYTSFDIGGCADYFVSVRSRSAAITAIRAAAELSLPAVVMGAGNNLLISDAGFRGLVIRNTWSGRIAQPAPTVLRAPGGVSLESVVEKAYALSLTGLEFATGIPGTVGGAMFMNAGAFGDDIGSHVNTGEVLTPGGEVLEWNRKDFRFDYRQSRLKRSGYMLLSVTLQLAPGKQRTIKKRMEEIRTLRRGKHPGVHVPWAGSYFRNLPPAKPAGRRTAAGFVLDKAGAKGMTVGGASVYTGHANFIINTGRATAQDVLILARQLKRLVRTTFDIRLREEVVYLDSDKGFRHL